MLIEFPVLNDMNILSVSIGLMNYTITHNNKNGWYIKPITNKILVWYWHVRDETIEHGDLIWSRQEFGTEYGYRPVIATKVTPNQEIYEVVVRHSNHTTETFKTTKEHPFWIKDTGWLKASLLEQGMTLLDKHGLPNVTIISQTRLTHTETVYNFEVQDFHAYHL